MKWFQNTKLYTFYWQMCIWIVGGGGGGVSSNSNARRDETVETGDESVEAGDESMEAGIKTQQSCYDTAPYMVPEFESPDGWGFQEDRDIIGLRKT